MKWNEFNKNLVMEGNAYLQELGVAKYTRVDNWEKAKNLWLCRTTAYENYKVPGIKPSNPGKSYQIAIARKSPTGHQALCSILDYRSDLADEDCPYRYKEELAKLKANIQLALESDTPFGKYIQTVSGSLEGLESTSIEDTSPQDFEERIQQTSSEIEIENRHARSSGQGYRVDPMLKAKIEQHAMEAAQRHYEDNGYTVDPSVALTKPYDLLCTKGTEELHVEVKGTTTHGESILLTHNEVCHAEEHPTALFILADIQVVGKGENVKVKGGRAIIHDPWILSDHGTAIPTHYRYSLKPETDLPD